MNEILASMNRYVPHYNPLSGEFYSDDVYRSDGAAIGYLQAWRQAMLEHYERLGIPLELEEEEEIDFSAPEWNTLVLS